MEDFTIERGLTPRPVPKRKKRYRNKQVKEYKDKQLETEHCIFITDKAFKDDLPPDVVRRYEPDGEHTKEKSDIDKMNEILRGIKW